MTQPPALDLAPGMTLGGRYRLEQRLGEGGMGEVWAATHAVTTRRVALKFLKPALAANPSAAKRFLREARAASAVRHRNIVQIHDVFQLESGVPVMVMDLLEGEALADRMARERRISIGTLARILGPVVNAVRAMHAAGIVHRDLKPENIFLVRTDAGDIEPIVLDFGIAKLTTPEAQSLETGNLTRTGAVLGTPFYMAPEQMFGEKDLDHRADVWAIGVILYEALSGKKPVDGENLGQLVKILANGNIEPLKKLVPELPADVVACVNHMLTVDKTARMSDLRELSLLFERYGGTTAEAFGPARPPARTEDKIVSDEVFAPTLGGDSHASAASANPTGSSAGASTTASFSTESRDVPARRSRIVALGAVLLAAILGLSALIAIRASHNETATSEPLVGAAPSVTPAAVPIVSTTPIESASATPSAAPSASAPPLVRPSLAHASGSAAKAKPSGTPESTPPTAPTPTKLPGGVSPNAPF